MGDSTQAAASNDGNEWTRLGDLIAGVADGTPDQQLRALAKAQTALANMVAEVLVIAADGVELANDKEGAA